MHGLSERLPDIISYWLLSVFIREFYTVTIFFQALKNHDLENTFEQFVYLSLYQLTFFIFFTTIGLNIIFGIIVDTFSELRDMKVEIWLILVIKLYTCNWFNIIHALICCLRIPMHFQNIKWVSYPMNVIDASLPLIFPLTHIHNLQTELDLLIP